MKFWELISAFREFDAIVASTVALPRWKQPFGQWYAERNELIHKQDRMKLDSTVPEALVLEVAATVGNKLSFHLKDGWLRRQGTSTEGELLSCREVIARFGGSTVEEVLECGSASVGT